MTVARILSQKGREVVTIQPHSSLKDVVALLAAKGIGAVVVSDASRSVLGIVSERDVMRALAAHGPEALSAPVSRHMTSKVTVTASNVTISEVMDLMTAGRFRHVPVVEGGKLIGLVSIGDVVKWRVQDIEGERRALQDYIAMA